MPTSAAAEPFGEPEEVTEGLAQGADRPTAADPTSTPVAPAPPPRASAAREEGSVTTGSNRRAIQGPSDEDGDFDGRDQLLDRALSGQAAPTEEPAPEADMAANQQAIATDLEMHNEAEEQERSQLGSLGDIAGAEDSSESFGFGGLGVRGSGRGGGGGGARNGAGEATRRRRRPRRAAYTIDATASGRSTIATTGADAGGVTTTVETRVRVRTQPTQVHVSRRCSDAADRLLDARRALWRERLANANGPRAWKQLYDTAGRACELPTWRARRAFLNLLLGKAGSVRGMIGVFRVFRAPSVRRYLRRAIIRRVRTPDDLRIARQTFGSSQISEESLIAQVLERAQTPAQKIRALRRLTRDYPQTLSLKLRLLELLERERKIPEARRLAQRLRKDAMTDAEARTAIGEMYLRLEDEAEARRVFSEIVEFAPRDELARRRLGDLYRAHGWFQDAYRQYQTLAEIRPDDPSVFLLLAQAAAGAGRVDEALRLERRLSETAQPGDSVGVARTALLWSSVRFATLRKAARDAGDDEKLNAVLSEMRRSGVLRESADLRVALVWSHPDAGVSLWASNPGSRYVMRPSDIAPEYNIEVFDVPEQESGAYQIEVRRPGDHLTDVSAKLVVLIGEGTADEVIEVRELSFARGAEKFAFQVQGRALSEVTP